jgi:TusA-related sulfurtransferase/rhodanese-related sulfurtransferase
MSYYLKNMLKYGRRTIRLFYRFGRRYEFSEITVDQLHDRINSDLPPLIIDIRSPKEFNGAKGHIQNAAHIPIRELKSNFEDLQNYKEKEVVTICPGGGMSLIAVDLLVEAGFQDVKSLHGGLDLWREKGYPLTTTTEDISSSKEDIKPSTFKERAKKIETKQPLQEEYTVEIHKTLNVRNLSCPIPVLKSKKTLKTLKMGQVLEILTTDPASQRDIPAWAVTTDQELLISEELGSEGFRFLVKRMK